MGEHVSLTTPPLLHTLSHIGTIERAMSTSTIPPTIQSSYRRLASGTHNNDSIHGTEISTHMENKDYDFPLEVRIRGNSTRGSYVFALTLSLRSFGLGSGYFRELVSHDADWLRYIRCVFVLHELCVSHSTSTVSGRVEHEHLLQTLAHTTLQGGELEYENVGGFSTTSGDASVRVECISDIVGASRVEFIETTVLGLQLQRCIPRFSTWYRSIL